MKERDLAQKKVTRANTRITEKASALLAFAKADLRRVMARQREIASRNINVKLMKPGLDASIASYFMRSKDKTGTVHSRMVDACDAYNRRFKAAEVLSPVLELSALVSVVHLYLTIIEGLE